MIEVLHHTKQIVSLRTKFSKDSGIVFLQPLEERGLSKRSLAEARPNPSTLTLLELLGTLRPSIPDFASKPLVVADDADTKPVIIVVASLGSKCVHRLGNEFKVVLVFNGDALAHHRALIV